MICLCTAIQHYALLPSATSAELAAALACHRTKTQPRGQNLATKKDIYIYSRMDGAKAERAKCQILIE